jgi:hypothetical protein
MGWPSSKSLSLLESSSECSSWCKNQALYAISNPGLYGAMGAYFNVAMVSAGTAYNEDCQNQWAYPVPKGESCRSGWYKLDESLITEQTCGYDYFQGGGHSDNGSYGYKCVETITPPLAISGRVLVLLDNNLHRGGRISSGKIAYFGREEVL